MMLYNAKDIVLIWLIPIKPMIVCTLRPLPFVKCSYSPLKKLFDCSHQNHNED